MRLLDDLRARTLSEYASQIQKRWRSYRLAKLQKQRNMSAVAVIIKGDTAHMYCHVDCGGGVIVLVVHTLTERLFVCHVAGVHSVCVIQAL